MAGQASCKSIVPLLQKTNLVNVAILAVLAELSLGTGGVGMLLSEKKDSVAML